MNINPKACMAANVAVSTSSTLHPDYQYWSPVWAKIRDAELGEVQVKAMGQKYLSKLAGHDNEQYRSFLNRAVFYNMTAKTLNALYGGLFKRAPKVTGYTDIGIFKDGSSLNLSAKIAAKEVLALGRYGMMVDAPAHGRGSAYVACYTAENILDWEMAEIDGSNQLTRVVLREVDFDRDTPDASAYATKSRFRVLALVPSTTGWVYEQHIYADVEGGGVPDFRHPASDVITPTVRGRPLRHIPFTFIGPFTNHPDVQKPPLLDIVTLNYSHYNSYAHLEQGRFYTANPVYTVSGATGDAGAGEYYVGPDMVWELGKDGKAQILEFGGQGLRSLENALTQKEAQIASIGGRMLPSAHGPGESSNALRLRENNEQSLLLNVADCVDEAFTQVIKWHADWSNHPRKKIGDITFEISRDILTKDAGAREFRAIHRMYADGVIPVDVVYEYLRDADVIPDWMDKDEYLRLLVDSKQFPNMVDVLARMQSFPDATAYHEARKAAA